MPPDLRAKVSAACAALGVMLLIAASLLADPAVPALAGVALLAVSHVLTPCRDQITRWWRQRISKVNPHA